MYVELNIFPLISAHISVWSLQVSASSNVFTFLYLLKQAETCMYASL